MTKPSIDEVWRRIVAHQGETFRTKTGLPFTYEVHGKVLRVSRTEQNIGWVNFKRALPLVPLEGPGQINDLIRGPSFVWAILHDPRVRRGDW